MSDLGRFLNRLRILRSLDQHEVPAVWWHQFRDDPYEYLIRCPDDEAEHIWTALRKREPPPVTPAQVKIIKPLLPEFPPNQKIREGD